MNVPWPWQQIAQLAQLVALDLSCTKLAAPEGWDLEPLQALGRLTWLSLAGCDVAALPAFVWRLPALQVGGAGARAGRGAIQVPGSILNSH